jgi:hypothetical protein
VFNALEVPYAIVGPYSTRESLGLSVVQVIRACDVVIADATTAEIDGGIPTILRLFGRAGPCAATIETALPARTNPMAQRYLVDMMALSRSLLSAARLSDGDLTRGFASPPRDGSAFLGKGLF